MATNGNIPTTLMDWVRPSEADGPLVGAVFSTYGLSLDQPDFFGQDFLPTLLGLGGVRDRGYASPVTLDRVLATADVSLICDAHALTAGIRPTLRVDVLPIGDRLHHAKLALIHRENRIRLIVASANLTHEGYRKQREAATVMDFHEDAKLPPAILVQAIGRWEEALGNVADAQVRRIFASAARTARRWAGAARGEDYGVEVVFGGGAIPLWRQLVEAWPAREPVLSWHICSPFWPQTTDGAGNTPFQVIAEALTAKRCSLADCDLEIVARADAPTPAASPRFPFPLVSHLRQGGFPVTKGRILPARLDAADDEIPDGMAGENRDLHAKWVVLAGPDTAVAYVGSANFTRRGFGVTRDPRDANIEAGILLRWKRGAWHPRTWRPPIQGNEINWASCAGSDLRDPPTEEEKIADWPSFIQRIELAIHWDKLPDPDGRLHILLSSDQFPDYHIECPQPSGPSSVLVAVPAGGATPSTVAVSPQHLRLILTRRMLKVVWNGGTQHCLFPVNILHDSKPGMPSILGAKPSEEQLLAYFHGRISEDDLLARLEQSAQEGTGPGASVSAKDVERLKRLQSYVVREFVESLFGLARTLRESCYSVRAAEQALLGDLSPVCLAEQIVHAYTAGKRSPTATAFQLAELARVIAEIDWSHVGVEERSGFENVRDRALARLLALVAQAATRPEFASVLQDGDFAEFVKAMLPAALARRWIAVGSPKESTGGVPA